MINKILLAEEVELGPIEGPGPWGNLGAADTPIETVASEFSAVISRIIGILTIIAGLYFIFQLIIGGYSYMTAGDDSQKMTKATKQITSSLIGLVIVAAAYAIISLLGSILGFDILNPAKLIIEELHP